MVEASSCMTPSSDFPAASVTQLSAHTGIYTDIEIFLPG
jgi:hypothetical protein